MPGCEDARKASPQPLCSLLQKRLFSGNIRDVRYRSQLFRIWIRHDRSLTLQTSCTVLADSVTRKDIYIYIYITNARYIATTYIYRYTGIYVRKTVRERQWARVKLRARL